MKILPPHGALTVTYSGRARELHSAISLQPAGQTNELKSYDGLWDTGATNTSISQKVVDDLSLLPIGMVEVFTPQGSHNTPAYLVEAMLKDSMLRFAGLRVTLGKLSNCDVLIGMDVIGLGDFAVTNKNGITVMTFRAPSMQTLDFVERMNQDKKAHFAVPKDRKKKHHR